MTADVSGFVYIVTSFPLVPPPQTFLMRLEKMCTRVFSVLLALSSFFFSRSFGLMALDAELHTCGHEVLESELRLLESEQR